MKALSLRLDLELITPELRKLFGPSGDKGLRREYPGQLSVQCISFGTLFECRTLRAFVFKLASVLLLLFLESLLDVAFGCHQLDLLGAGSVFACTLFGLDLCEPRLDLRECLELLERDRDRLGLRRRHVG